MIWLRRRFLTSSNVRSIKLSIISLMRCSRTAFLRGKKHSILQWATKKEIEHFLAFIISKDTGIAYAYSSIPVQGDIVRNHIPNSSHIPSLPSPSLPSSQVQILLYYKSTQFMTSVFNESLQLERQSQLSQPPSSRMSYSLMALLYKSISIYKKNYCSNICQLLTPILCIAFTIAVRIITEKVVSGNVGNFAFVQPFHLPIASKMVPGMKVGCTEKYYYSVPDNKKTSVQLQNELFGSILKTYCSESAALEPQFILSKDPNKQTLDRLFEADKQVMHRGIDLKTAIPDGLIKIHELTTQTFNTTVSINDWRLPEYHKNNGVTKLDLHANDQMIVSYLRVSEGLMSLIEMITRSFLQISDKKEIISGSFMYMPFSGEDMGLINKIINLLGSGLYPLGLSLLIPVFLFGIVSEKEEKLIEIMKMNGLLMKYYWINFFFFNLLISLLSCGLLFVFGRFVFDITFFSSTHWTVLWTLFIGWSIAQVSLTAFIQIFINSSKAATIIGYLLSIFSTLIGQALSMIIYPVPMQLPLILKFYPPLGLSRGIYLIGNSCANNSSCFKSLNGLGEEMYIIYFSLYSWILMFILSIYLHNMIHQQYGTTRVPTLLKRIIDFFKSEPDSEAELNQTQYNALPNRQENNDPSMMEQLEEDFQESNPNQLIDESVFRLATLTKTFRTNERPLIVKNLAKTYDNGFAALRANTFHLEEKQIFGLLGPNGAGKTTLISVLTGLYDSTNGSAWIDGKEVGSQQANTRIGVCPQFDLLWENLTISQHMYIYGLLKGVKLDILEDQVRELLSDVDLLKERDMQSCELSGGMKRRLSLAIALTGNPKVVILDEPSSGLDPSHRRQMWDILLKCKKRTTILLTTHLMEEAQALCDRIGIIDKGLLRCVGTQQELKQKFGKGYRLTLNFKQWKGERSGVLKNLQELGCELVNDLQSRIMVKVPKQKMLECVKNLRKFDSLNWLMGQPSLYDVFMHFIN